MSPRPTSPTILVDDVDATGTDLECSITVTPDLERFVSGEPFRASYDVPIEDVPEGVLVVPLLAQLAPVAWATGADIYVPTVDARFARALEDVKASLLSMYDFLEGGSLHARDLVEVPAHDGGESGLLFTGGVDSTCSYVRHRDEEPTLISVRGWTVSTDAADDEKWDALRSRVTGFADERDLETAFVESNMLSFLEHFVLLAHFKRFVDGAWYSSVGHGLGLLGLCAPMAYACGMGSLYVGATHWEGIDLEWGSRPDIDDYVAWAGTRCHHDAYDLTRQERLDTIADYVRTDAPDLQLQTCNVQMDGNCGRCEKCYRTAVGLRLAGLEPTAHGYAEVDYDDLRRSFERGAWVLGEDERYMWADIRERVRETTPASPAEREFFAWLESADLADLVDDSAPPVHHRALRAGARNAPDALYTTLYPAYDSVRRVARRMGI
ncbi:hypothetical protein [Natronobiforma cellulositropha]|uniref:hypothetical protein n=1 Tax=Natronobiforma cellulositropha TaxID=1679076 RepID=UPI0021D5FA75|nr:hypothetical protein [Natronobiforma cellulositropha]